MAVVVDEQPQREPIRAKAVPRCSICGDMLMVTDSVCESCTKAIKHDESIIDVIAVLEDITLGDGHDRCCDAASMLRKLLRRKS